MIDNVGDVFSGFLFISTHISLDLLSLGSAEAYIGWSGKLFFTQMMINLHEILSSCSRRNTNSKYFNKIWQLIKYFFAIRDVTLTSKCITGTGLLVSTGAFSCYSASMMNLIWFTDERCLSCQH